jgi:hypothetical protein
MSAGTRFMVAAIFVEVIKFVVAGPDPAIHLLS